MIDPATLTGYLIGIVGIIASFVFYIRSKEQPKPVFRTGDIPLIGGKTPLLPADVEVIYRGEKVQSLVKSYIAFWNAGRKKIDGSDIVETDPIRFEPDDPKVKILSARIVHATRKVDQAVLEYTEKEARLKFDFLDPQDGVTLEVIHTGVGRRLDCGGTIKGVPRGIRRAHNPLPFNDFFESMFGSNKSNTYLPPDLRKTTIGWTMANIAFQMFGLLIGFGLAALGIAALLAHSQPGTVLSYKQYQKIQTYNQYVRYSHGHSTAAGGKPLGIILLVFAGLMIVFLLTFIIRAWRLRVPARIALTSEEVSS